MSINKKSAALCACLAAVSVLAARIGNDEGHLPAKDYTRSVQNVFAFTDSELPLAISDEAKDALLSVLEEKDEVKPATPFTDVLEPIIKPPADGTSVYAEN